MKPERKARSGAPVRVRAEPGARGAVNEPGKPNMCFGCSVGCCSLRVDLTSYDLYRIIMLEGREVSEFVELVIASPGDHFGFLCNKGLVKMALRRAGTREGGFCVFHRSAGPLRCSIEYSKPSVCLSYPFDIERGVPYLRTDIKCPEANVLLADKSKMSKEMLEDYDWEYERYGEMVSDWNRSATGAETAAQFIGFVTREMQMESTPLGSLWRKALRAARKIGVSRPAGKR